MSNAGRGNPNYRAGRAFEYEAMKMLKARGYDKTGRAAGSHGIFDVYGIKDNHAILISCKVVQDTSEISGVRTIWECDCQEMPKLPKDVDYECWVKIKGQGIPIAWRREH